MIKNPNAWSCLPTSFAMALGYDLYWLIGQLGHDGSEITHAGLPNPLCRRGFHPQELIKLCLEHALVAVTRIEKFPQSIPCQDATLFGYKGGDPEWFNHNLFNTFGVLDCRTHAGIGHAMAYEGHGDHAIIHDPADASRFIYRTPADGEARDRYIFALWRLDRLGL